MELKIKKKKHVSRPGAVLRQVSRCSAGNRTLTTGFSRWFTCELMLCNRAGLRNFLAVCPFILWRLSKLQEFLGEIVSSFWVSGHTDTFTKA